MPRPLSYPPFHVDSTVLGGASITLALKAPQVILVVSQLWGSVFHSVRRGAYTPLDDPAMNDIADIYLKSINKEGCHFKLTQEKDYGLNEQKVLKS